jgi:hypothetical protein
VPPRRREAAAVATWRKRTGSISPAWRRRVVTCYPVRWNQALRSLGSDEWQRVTRAFATWRDALPGSAVERVNATTAMCMWHDHEAPPFRPDDVRYSAPLRLFLGVGENHLVDAECSAWACAATPFASPFAGPVEGSQPEENQPPPSGKRSQTARDGTRKLNSVPAQPPAPPPEAAEKRAPSEIRSKSRTADERSPDVVAAHILEVLRESGRFRALRVVDLGARRQGCAAWDDSAPPKPPDTPPAP